VISVLVTQLSVDLINTTSLCILLRSEKTGTERTDTVLNKLVVWTIETGVITSLAAVLMLIFCLVLPNTTIWVAISIFYSKLYSNSLMASLNARNSLRTVMDESDVIELSSGGTTVNFSRQLEAPKTSKSFQRPDSGDSKQSTGRPFGEDVKQTLADDGIGIMGINDGPFTRPFVEV